MFNLDKILRRSLSQDTAKMKEKYEYYIKIDNGVDLLYVYLTKKELKKLTIKDEFGNEELNIPDKKVRNLWSEYYNNQKTYREENIIDVFLKDIPNFEGHEYIDFAHLLTVEEWMKVVNCEVAMTTDNDGKIKLEPIVVLEDYTVENLVNKTDIHNDFIYYIDFGNDENLTPMTFKQLKEYAKSEPKVITIPDDEYTDAFAQFFTEDEFEKIKNGEIVLFKARDRTLMISVND